MPDHREAEKWLKRSAEQENMKARIALGSLYADRHGLVQNDVLALLWFNFAVSQGSREALSLREDLLRRMTPAQIMEAQRLGREYKSERDYKNMVRDLKPQALSGDASAQMKLGTLYYRGQGVSRDYAEAARLFLLAAEKGDPYAQSNLGYMYELGEGIPQDYGQAAGWYLKAARAGEYAGPVVRRQALREGSGRPPERYPRPDVLYPGCGKWRRPGDHRAGPTDGLDVSRSGRRGPASGAGIQDRREMRSALCM